MCIFQMKVYSGRGRLQGKYFPGNKSLISSIIFCVVTIITMKANNDAVPKATKNLSIGTLMGKIISKA